jgi:hypothetical protein
MEHFWSWSADGSGNNLFALTNAGKCSFEVCAEPDDLNLKPFECGATLNATGGDRTTTGDRKDV